MRALSGQFGSAGSRNCARIAVVEISGVRGRYTTVQISRRSSNRPAQSSPTEDIGTKAHDVRTLPGP
jgi:hypothetical protein